MSNRDNMFDDERNNRQAWFEMMQRSGFGGMHDRGFPGGPGRDGHGRPGRFMEQKDFRLIVLDLLWQEPRHGYEVIKAVEDLTGGGYAPSPGVIYPTLTYLEETGLVTSEAQGNKKLYRVTDAGREFMSENESAIEAIHNKFQAARERFGLFMTPEIMRAMNNLRSAIMLRLGKGELSTCSVSAFTAALDNAAREIEKC